MAKARGGRPRSEKSQEAIRTATRELLQETGGAGLTIEAIARRAKVGKPTIYRWWPSLADIVLEVLLCQADSEIAAPNSGSLEQRLRIFLRQSMQAITRGAGLHLRFLLAQAQQDEAFCARFRENFTAKRRAALRSILVHPGEETRKEAPHNLETLMDLIFGAMWYRLLIGHAPLDAAFADELAELTVRLLEPETAKSESE